MKSIIRHNFIVGNDQLNDELDSQKQRYEKIIKRKKQDYEGKIQELKQKLNECSSELHYHKNRNESLEITIEEIQKELDRKKEDVSDLEKRNIVLREEASKYQSALGVAENFRMNDDDKNHTVQLKNDILSLQDTIESYVTNLKGKIEINIDNTKNLLQHYGCLTKITTEKPNKPLIKAILQRHVLDTIIKNANEYFKHSGSTVSLESEILMKAKELCSVLNKFSETRDGTDTITSTSSIKVRQEACVAL